MRRRLVLTALAMMSIAFSGLSWRAAHPTTPKTSEETLEAPVLSPRRMPDLLASVGQDAKVRSALNGVLTGSGNSCLVIYTEGRLVVDSSTRASYVSASTLKLLTAFTALDLLGKDTTFVTAVRASVKPKNGNIEGSLYLVGGGDPLLMTNDYHAALKARADVHSSLETLADRVVAEGVRRVSGGVIGDDTMFDTQRSIPTWEPSYLNQGQVGAIGALLLNQGFSRVGNVQSPTSDPPLHAASVLATLLRARGVEIAGSTSAGKTPEKATEIASLSSAPVSAIVRQMLTQSDNTTAEMVLKKIAFKHSGRGITADGITAVRTSLERHRIPTEGLVMTDGSGLDRGNRATCRTIAAVLARSEADGDLADGLARAGESGTLRDRMLGGAAIGRVKAKTGTLSDVSGLAGWAFPVGRSPVAFTILNNGARSESSRRHEDQLANLLAGLPAVPPTDAYAPE